MSTCSGPHNLAAKQEEGKHFWLMCQTIFFQVDGCHFGVSRSNIIIDPWELCCQCCYKKGGKKRQTYLTMQIFQQVVRIFFFFLLVENEFNMFIRP